MAIRAMTSAVTGMNAQQTHIDIISNNLANITTTGYKREDPNFETLLYQDISRSGANPTGNQIVPTGIQIGLGTKLSSVSRNFEQGSLQETNNNFDIAIQGKGFFQILLPDNSIAYTRAGNFTINNSGQIVTQNGYLLQPTIQIPQGTTSVTISDTGVVTTIVNNDSNNMQQQGIIQLSTFVNENGLDELGGNLLAETPASGPPTTNNPNTNDVGKLLQGWLETSNVNPVKELTTLITAQRSYELCSKVINASDQILQVINNLKN